MKDGEFVANTKLESDLLGEKLCGVGMEHMNSSQNSKVLPVYLTLSGEVPVTEMLD